MQISSWVLNGKFLSLLQAVFFGTSSKVCSSSTGSSHPFVAGKVGSHWGVWFENFTDWRGPENAGLHRHARSPARHGVRLLAGKFHSCCFIPLCWVTFCIHSGIIPVGQFSRICAKSINQAYNFIVNLFNHCDLIGLLDSYRPICFYGGGAKVTQYYGTIQLLFSRHIVDYVEFETNHGLFKH